MSSIVRHELRYAWKGAGLLVVNAQGASGPDQKLAGFYFRETRFIRTLTLRLDDEPPWLCEAAAPDAATLAFTYVYPELVNPGGGGTGQAGDEEGANERGIPYRSLDLRLLYRVSLSGLHLDLQIVNRARTRVACNLTLDVDADFADLLEAHSGDRRQHANVNAATSDNTLRLTYAHDRLPFEVRVRASEGWNWKGSRAVSSLALGAQESIRLVVDIEPCYPSSPAADTSSRANLHERWQREMTSLQMPQSGDLESIFRNNVADIASFPLLDGAPDEWLALQAGMPMYPAFFGRDAVTAGWQVGLLDQGRALDAALCKLSRLQSNRFDDWRDEEPGRIPYQVRSGPLAALGINPYAAYYADFASPLMFVIALANLWAWTGRDADVNRHWDTARRILDWAREHGDADRDGYLEYKTRSSDGAKNQGWKDSGDAIVYDDGRPVSPPIATCELQGYWYIAQELMALLCTVRGDTANAKAHRDSAQDLKRRFNKDWWMEDERFFALALDADKQQVRAVTSHVGHCLATGIIDRDLPAVVGRLFAPDLFSGWGIRTLSSGHAFYNPLSYHRGSVWAVEQATIIFGLRRFGFDARVVDLSRALFDLARLYPLNRIPECVGGYDRREWPTPAAYPQANTPQLWNATAFPLVMQTLLGIVPIAALNTVLIDPLLPTWMPEVLIRDLRVGGGKVTLRAWHDSEGRAKWDVVHRQGVVHVIEQPAPESRSATWTDRLTSIFHSVFH
jgi:glycogen debranching enzyme